MRERGLEYSRTFNLGDFQSERISLTVDLDETEDLDEVFRTVKAKVLRLHEKGQLIEGSKAAVEAEEHKWDPQKIVWTQAEGTRGPYERSEDVNNLQFKAMIKDLAAHDGKLTKNGFFYWLFETGAVVGRKRKRK